MKTRLSACLASLLTCCGTIIAATEIPISQIPEGRSFSSASNWMLMVTNITGTTNFKTIKISPSNQLEGFKALANWPSASSFYLTNMPDGTVFATTTNWFLVGTQAAGAIVQTKMSPSNVLAALTNLSSWPTQWSGSFNGASTGNFFGSGVGTFSGIMSGAGSFTNMWTNSLWVAPTGSDANIGTYASPMLTVQAAITKLRGIGTVNMASGDYYRQSVNLATCTNITIIGSIEGRTRVLMGSPVGATNFYWLSNNIFYATNYVVNGVTNHITNATPALYATGGDLVSAAWIFQWNTPQYPIYDTNYVRVTPYARASGHGNYRLEHYRLAWPYLPNVILADTARFFTNSAGGWTNGNWIYTNSTLYVRFSDDGTNTGRTIFVPWGANTGVASNDIAATQLARGFLTNGVSSTHIKVANVEVYFAGAAFSFGNAGYWEAINCKAIGCAESGFIAGNSMGVMVQCESGANCNDGFSGTATTTNKPSIEYEYDCWMHDNGSTGTSIHYNFYQTLIGGYYDHNFAGGSVPFGGAQNILYNVTTRENGVMSFLLDPYSTSPLWSGGAGLNARGFLGAISNTVAIAYNCVFDWDDISVSAGHGAIVDLYNCQLDAFRLNPRSDTGAKLRLHNCYSELPTWGALPSTDGIGTITTASVTNLTYHNVRGNLWADWLHIPTNGGAPSVAQVGTNNYIIGNSNGTLYVYYVDAVGLVTNQTLAPYVFRTGILNGLLGTDAAGLLMATNNYTYPTNPAVNGATVDLNRTYQFTNAAGDITFTGLLNVENSKVKTANLLIGANGADRVVTIPGQWMNHEDATAFVVTNTWFAEMTVKCYGNAWTSVVWLLIK